jgi:hypothetical protein
MMLDAADTERVAAVGKVRETATDSQGYTYYTDDGEIIGHVSTPETFRIDTTEKADWALDKRSEIEADLLAIRARKRALLENLTRLERTIEARLTWWDFRFRAEVIAFAREAIRSIKGKTLRLTYGSIAFRTSRGTNSIFDMEQAVAFVAKFAPEHVKRVETVNVKGIMEAARSYKEATEEDASLGAFLASTGSSESVVIKTGVGDDEKGDD